MNRYRRLWAGLAVGSAVLATLGCRSTGSEPRPTDPTASGTVDAGEVLAEYGLVLPATAEQVEATALPDWEDGSSDVYRVTFTAPAEDVGQMCVDAGINGPWIVSGLSDTDIETFGVDVAPEGSRICRGGRPGYYDHAIRVLFWDDPASVLVVLLTMPR